LGSPSLPRRAKGARAARHGLLEHRNYQKYHGLSEIPPYFAAKRHNPPAEAGAALRVNITGPAVNFGFCRGLSEALTVL